MMFSPSHDKEHNIMLHNAILPIDNALTHLDEESFTLPATHCAYLPAVKKALSQTAKYGAAIGTSFSASIYSLGFPSHTSPDKISWRWWDNLSKMTKFLSLSNALINLIIGIMVRLAYFPKIIEAIKEEYHKTVESKSACTKNILILFLAIIAAIAGGALVYESFIASGALLAGLNALANMIIIAGFRFVSLSTLFAKIINLFDSDYQFQQQCVTHLKSMQINQSDEMAMLLNGKELNEETVREFLTVFYDRVSQSEVQLNMGSSKLEKIGKFFDTTLGFSLGIPYLLFFSQKGLDGIKIIASHVAPSASIDALSTALKMFIGLTIGSSSGVLAFLSGYDLRKLLQNLYEDFKNHPVDILKLLVLLPATTISALSLTSAAEAMTAIPNIFGIANNAYGTLFTALLTLMAVCFDFKAVAETAILDHPEDTLKIKNIGDWLEINKLSKDNVAALRQHTLFTSLNTSKLRESEQTLMIDQDKLSYVV